MRRIWVPRNKLLNPIIQNAKTDLKDRKDGTSFLSCQVFLDIVHRTRNWSQRVKRLARTAPSRMVLYLGNHHISTSETFSQNSRSLPRNIWETSDVSKNPQKQSLPRCMTVSALTPLATIASNNCKAPSRSPFMQCPFLGKKERKMSFRRNEIQLINLGMAMLWFQKSFKVKSLKCIQSVDPEHVGDHCPSISARQIAREISAVKGPNHLSKDLINIQYIVRCASIDKKRQWHHCSVIAASKWHQWRVRHGVCLHTILTGKQWWEMLNGMNVDSRTEHNGNTSMARWVVTQKISTRRKTILL